MPYGTYDLQPGIQVEKEAFMRGTVGPTSVAAGQLVAIANSGGSPVVVLADANSTGAEAEPSGGAIIAGVTGEIIGIRVAGELDVPDAYWDSVPAATAVGSRVYMSETAGNWTTTMPTTTGVMQIQVGKLTRGGTGACKVQVSLQRGVRKQ